jgi:hypothetical protein
MTNQGIVRRDGGTQMTTIENAIRRPTPSVPTVEQEETEQTSEGPPSTGMSLLEFLNSGQHWHGDDLEECLAAVYFSRGVWYP